MCSKLFDTLIVFLKGFFQKVDFEKKLADGKKAGKISQWAKEAIAHIYVINNKISRTGPN